MKFDRAAAIGDEGVAAVNYYFSRQQWIFREVTKRDVGIDAIVEVCEAAKATSRLLSLQIKSGRSYFREASPDGWLYRGDADHLDYFLAHSLPVLMVLYDPEAERAWWAHVQEGAVRQTKAGWTIVVPRDQPLDEHAAASLREIASDIPQYERLKLPTTRPWNHRDRGVAPTLEVIHAARKELLVSTPYISREFVAILEFVATRTPVRCLVSDNAVSREAAALITDQSRLQIRCAGHNFHNKSFILDRNAVCFGSAQLVWGALQNHEIMVCVTERARVRSALRAFEELWAESDHLNRPGAPDEPPRWGLLDDH